jgi:hypothetical protein
MNSVIGIALQFILYLVLQLYFFDGLISFEQAVPKGFLAFLLFLPMALPKPVQYLVAFAFGLALDILVMPYGAHAFTCTLLIGVREFWLRATAGQSMDEAEEGGLDLRQQARSFGWIISYLLPLAFVYEIVYILITDFTIDSFKLLEILFSGLYSFAVNFILIVLIYRVSR